MTIQSLALDQLVNGLALATASFELGRTSDAIVADFLPYFPTEVDDSALLPAVEPLRELYAVNGHPVSFSVTDSHDPQIVVRAFFEAANQLHEITQESHPQISLWAGNVRQVWRRGLSYPPRTEATPPVGSIQTDEGLLIEWLRHFIEFSPQPMGVVKCHPDGNAEMVMFNKKNRERWGLKEKDVAGIDVMRFFYPEDRERVRAFIRECLESGGATRTGFRMLRSAGGHLLVDMYVGRVDETNYAYFQVIDESQREEAFEQVRVRDAVFRNAGKPLLMLRFGDDGVASGMVTSLGFHRMLGYAPGEIGTKPVMDFIPPHLQETFAEKLRQFLETGSLIWPAVELMHKDGSAVLVDIEANDSGVKNQRFAIVSFGDAKARIAAERDAAEAQKLEIVSKVTATIAHEANNMLTIISGGLQLLETRYPEDEFLSTMIQNAYMLDGMMKNFRQLTDTIHDEINLHSILNESNIRLIVPKIRNVEIVFDLAEAPWSVAGPNFAVWYFVYTIIKNAMEAMENVPTRRLTLSTENVEVLDATSLRRLDPRNRFPDARPGAFLKLSVEDTGSGIPAEILERIFEDYFSTKDSTEVSRGRGLFGAQRAIARRGGLLDIRSQVGRGSVFIVYLPRAAGGPVAKPSATAPAAVSSGLPDKGWESPGNEVLLIADDDEDVRAQYAKILKFYNYSEVLFAGTTQETLKIARERHDLTAIVMDWRMPGDTGDDLLADLLALRPKLPILVNTGAVPDHTDRYPGVRFTPKLKGPTAVGRALRRLIKGEPID